jgi:hypothetical protein
MLSRLNDRPIDYCGRICASLRSINPASPEMSARRGSGKVMQACCGCPQVLD